MAKQTQGGGGGVNPTRSSAQVLIMRELSKFFLSGVMMTGRPSLGVGAYGSVEPLELNRMKCAGKRIHDVLVDVGNEGADDMAARFVEECRLMSELRHPHVVQFLGLCLSPSSPLPILVMEHLYSSLDELLDSARDIPLYMKRSILRDVALGLAHLHGRHPAIIHRDLTARNVLLNNNMQAKLADFGVARILNLPPGKLEATLTRVPGTSAYMPPEVFDRDAKYSTSVDIFSFGHLVLYTITQKQPRVEAATYVNSLGSIVARSEIERREDSVTRLYGILGKEHPFVEIATSCLQTNALLRPSVLKVLNQLEQMKSSVRDPYSRQTRLTLTQMIRKKAAENKKMAADLQRAQDDLLNAKKRIVHLTEQLHRYQQAQDGPPLSPTSTLESSIHNYYNTDEAAFKGNGQVHDHYSRITHSSTSPPIHQPRTFSSPTLPSLATGVAPPVPSSPRPSSPSHFVSSSYVNSAVPSPSLQVESSQSPFLSLPRSLNTRHLSHENLNSDHDYAMVASVSQRKHSDSCLHEGHPLSSSATARTSPFLDHGFSTSESDSDFDELVEPRMLRKKGLPSVQPFAPLNFSSLPLSSPSSSPSSSLYQTHSPSSNIHSHSNSTPPPVSFVYQTHSPSSSSTLPSPSLYQTHSPLSSAKYLSQPSRRPPLYQSQSTPPSPSYSSSKSSAFDSVYRVPVNSDPMSVTSPPSSSSSSSSSFPPQPLATGMAGKLHFYTDLEPNTLLLLQKTENGKIPGVRYDCETGQVKIESDSVEKTKLASEKFRTAYVYATREQMSITVDVPGEVTESAMEEIISVQGSQFSKSVLSYNGIESSVSVISFSGGEVARLKRALEEAIQKAYLESPKPLQSALSTPPVTRSGHITGKMRLTIKKASLELEDTDVIVFANTSNLACKDGAAKAVDEASHGAISSQCKAFITKHGLLGFGETVLMKGGGKLKTKYVVHVNPGVGSCIKLREVMRKLVTQTLKLATGKGVSSVAFSPLISARSEADMEIVARTMLDSLKTFANDKKGRKLRDIRIVVQNQAAFDCFSEHAKLS